MMHVASGVFAGGICLGISADFFKYAAKLLVCATTVLVPRSGRFGLQPNRILRGNLEDFKKPLESRFRPRSGRFGFPTEPVLSHKLFRAKRPLEFRRSGVFIEKRLHHLLNPVMGFAWVFLQNVYRA